MMEKGGVAASGFIPFKPTFGTKRVQMKHDLRRKRNERKERETHDDYTLVGGCNLSCVIFCEHEHRACNRVRRTFSSNSC